MAGKMGLKPSSDNLPPDTVHLTNKFLSLGRWKRNNLRYTAFIQAGSSFGLG